MAGLDPAIPLRRALCVPKRDARHKAGHDNIISRCNAYVADVEALAPSEPAAPAGCCAFFSTSFTDQMAPS